MTSGQQERATVLLLPSTPTIQRRAHGRDQDGDDSRVGIIEEKAMCFGNRTQQTSNLNPANASPVMATPLPPEARAFSYVASSLPRVAMGSPRVAGGLPEVAMRLLQVARVLPTRAVYPSSLLGFPMVQEVTDQPNDQPFRYGVCRNSLAFLLSNSNLSAFQFSFTPGVRWAATPRSTISVSCPP
jgi:hypothetical protein